MKRPPAVKPAGVSRLPNSGSGTTNPEFKFPIDLAAEWGEWAMAVTATPRVGKRPARALEESALAEPANYIRPAEWTESFPDRHPDSQELQTTAVPFLPT